MRQHFESGAARPPSVLDADVARAPAVVLDLADDPFDPGDVAAASRSIADQVRRAGAAFALGRYGEDRHVYARRSTSCPTAGDGTLHLGVDLFAAAGTAGARSAGTAPCMPWPTTAPPCDYGGVLILAHRTV